MNRRHFTTAEIKIHSADLPTWHEFVRRREFEFIIDALGSHTKFRKALELGAGEGGQSITISKYCETLTCTELSETGNALIGCFKAKNLPNVNYELCDACDLSRFYQEKFDLIFSSNMLEHIPHPEMCLNECRKVLDVSGLMIHTMPTRQWKFWNCVVDCAKGRPHQIHGVSKSHMQEWSAFSSARWKAVLSRSGFQVLSVVGLPFYFGHGPSPKSLLYIGNRLRWCGTIAYICCPENICKA